ncbi:RNA polymerase sigma factor [Luteolibacter sp. LG18]|uniref:RNA polymerase sigma factor n=1 Tax=Luteolibacter sp. LG18 TaxID=2819286 RepID=UPI002B2E84ED|nr:RNA polymerase sigma factor [Luteolibacter sp. LG18]
MSEFQELVDAHYQPLFRFAVSLTRDPDRAADLVQETFCTWAEKGDQLRDRSKAKTWLFTTLHREFLGQRRRASRYSDEPVESLHGTLASSEDDPDRQMDGQRALELLGSLDETFRAPLALFYLQQHSYKEIAEILEIPIGTVMSRIARAKDMLRRQMTAEPASAPKNILQLNPEALRQHHG